VDREEDPLAKSAKGKKKRILFPKRRISLNNHKKGGRDIFYDEKSLCLRDDFQRRSEKKITLSSSEGKRRTKKDDPLQV